jgi:hypothetical protein
LIAIDAVSDPPFAGAPAAGQAIDTLRGSDRLTGQRSPGLILVAAFAINIPLVARGETDGMVV